MGYCYRIVHSTTSESYLLLPQSIEQVTKANRSNDDGSYQLLTETGVCLSRMSVRRVFRVGETGCRVGHLRYPSRITPDGLLKIGCQTFDKTNTYGIKRWLGLI